MTEALDSSVVSRSSAALRHSVPAGKKRVRNAVFVERVRAVRGVRLLPVRSSSAVTSIEVAS